MGYKQIENFVTIFVNTIQKFFVLYSSMRNHMQKSKASTLQFLRNLEIKPWESLSLVTLLTILFLLLLVKIVRIMYLEERRRRRRRR